VRHHLPDFLRINNSSFITLTIDHNFIGEVYWTDTAYRQIGVADPRTGKCRLVVYRDLGTIEGIAVDHIGRKVCFNFQVFGLSYTTITTV
jgi:hypothetical protein